MGVPVMIPVRKFRLSPAGRTGVTLYVLTAPPLLAGVFAGIGINLV